MTLSNLRATASGIWKFVRLCPRLCPTAPPRPAGPTMEKGRPQLWKPDSVASTCAGRAAPHLTPLALGGRARPFRPHPPKLPQIWPVWAMKMRCLHRSPSKSELCEADSGHFEAERAHHWPKLC